MVKVLNVNGRNFSVGESIAEAVTLIEHDYGGEIEVDNGQAKGPFVAYGFPRHGAVQIGVRLNKQKLTFYLRERAPDGRLMRDLVPGLQVNARYDGTTGNPVHSIKDGRVRYLKPGESPVLQIAVQPEQLRAVLDASLGLVPLARGASTAAGGTVDGMPAETAATSTGGTRGISLPPLTPEELIERQDGNSMLGRHGEEIALQFELSRLRDLGCSTPGRYVKHVAVEDVGRGFDIESTWPGEERYIEVKTTSVAGSDFFITANERKVLQGLGQRAWIYRIEPNPVELGVAQLIRDPINTISEDSYTPQVWRVKWPKRVN
ncbi:DUF3883 domain-containing protein [Tianweitania sp.]|uniref:DUF3883 domain-containing protein n=1 Tax=Tianweitania sp. TaxID=2021634 RepID=UPI0028970244|nr:DUF3883 domain-containing protein [Tianweitania sp.]